MWEKNQGVKIEVEGVFEPISHLKYHILADSANLFVLEESFAEYHP